jgi:CheY-like chemotaxis protein
VYSPETHQSKLRDSHSPSRKNAAFRPKAAAPLLMIVEDDSQSLYLIQRYASTSGCRLVSAWEGKDALRLARQARPTLILLDLVLSGMMGWEVLQLLRADPLTCHIPIVICSALDEADHAQEVGAVGYLRKPVYYQDFVAALKQAGLPL